MGWARPVEYLFHHCWLGGLSVLLVGCASVSGYRVQTGDTLYAISWKYGLDYREVARWNNLAPPYRIFPGQTLELQAPLDTQWTLLSKSENSPAPVVTPRVESPSNARTQARPPVRSSQSAAPAIVAPAPAAPLRKPQIAIRWQWPAQGPASERKKDRLVVGLEIRGRLDQPVYAAAAGRVVYSGDGLKGYGNLVIIKHDDEFFSAYAHNRRLLVRDEQQVNRGERVAEMGHDSENQPILYFEIRKDGKPVDPRRYLPKSGG